MEFNRLFTISAFEGLRLIRLIQAGNPNSTAADCASILEGQTALAVALDLAASVYLHDVVPAHAPADTVLFYRECVMAVMIGQMPTWAKLMTLGRGRFIKSLKGDEYRDIRSVFRESLLLEDPPTNADVRWWDILTARVRLNNNIDRDIRSRLAEELSLRYEKDKLEQLGIDTPPRWMAIEDNTVGYDVLSYRPSHESTANLLIEVKSTIASPMRFIISRNEWNVADQAGDAYLFHVWDMKDQPILYIRTVEQVRPHIPQDNEKGKWKDAEIPL